VSREPSGARRRNYETTFCFGSQYYAPCALLDSRGTAAAKIPRIGFASGTGDPTTRGPTLKRSGDVCGILSTLRKKHPGGVSLRRRRVGPYPKPCGRTRATQGRCVCSHSLRHFVPTFGNPKSLLNPSTFKIIVSVNCKSKFVRGMRRL